MNGIETMMRFVSMMDENVRGGIHEERTFLREEAWIIILWKGVQGYIKTKI